MYHQCIFKVSSFMGISTNDRKNIFSESLNFLKPEAPDSVGQIGQRLKRDRSRNWSRCRKITSWSQDCSTGRWNCRTKQKQKTEYESSCHIGFNIAVTMILLVWNTQHSNTQDFSIVRGSVPNRHNPCMCIAMVLIGRHSRINVLFTSSLTPVSRILGSDTRQIRNYRNWARIWKSNFNRHPKLELF